MSLAISALTARVEDGTSSVPDALLTVATGGDYTAKDTLFSSLYCELHRLAKRELMRRWSPASLGVTTLLHEAYLDISARDKSLLSRPSLLHGIRRTCYAGHHYRSCPQSLRHKAGW